MLMLRSLFSVAKPAVDSKQNRTGTTIRTRFLCEIEGEYFVKNKASKQTL